MADNKLASQIEQIVLNRLANDNLVVPMLPTAAIAALNLLKNPTSGLKDVAQCLERDPVLAAQILRVANCAAYASAGGRASTIDQAVNRLGMQKIKTVVIEASAYKIFQSGDADIAKACRAIWEHSIAVALLARDLATLSGSQEGEAAYLCGLLHDVGKPVIAAMLLEAEKVVSQSGPRKRWIESAEWIDAINSTHRRVGVAVAEHWKLPEPIQNAIRDCAEYDANNRQSAANFVRFSNALVKTQGIYVGNPDLEDANALVMIGRSLLNLDDELVGRLTSDLKVRVAEQLT